MQAMFGHEPRSKKKEGGQVQARAYQPNSTKNKSREARKLVGYIRMSHSFVVLYLIFWTTITATCYLSSFH